MEATVVNIEDDRVERHSEQGGSSSGSGSGSGGSSSQAWSDSFSNSAFHVGVGLLQRLAFYVHEVRVARRAVLLAFVVFEIVQWLTLPFEVTIARASGMTQVGKWLAVIRAPQIGSDARGVVIWCILGVVAAFAALAVFEWLRLQRGATKPHERILWLLKWFSVLLPVLYFPVLNVCFFGSCFPLDVSFLGQ